LRAKGDQFLVNKKKFILLDFLNLIIPLSGLIGSGLSLYKKFDARLVFTLAALIALVFASALFRHINLLPRFTAPKKIAILFTLILVASTAIRWPPFLYLAGGQDQGVYVSLASYIDRTGDFNVFDDPTLNLVPKESADYYLKHRPAFYGGYFSFYPVHPVLMAISKNFFGEDMTTLPNALIGIITAIVFYLITYLITKNRYLSLLMMSFIAFHPLHRFFSIFPATEIPSLFFTSMAFYYFLKFNHQESGSKPPISLLIFSLVYWLAFLFTRMNSFVYIPLLYGSLVLTPFLVKEKLKRLALTSYFTLLLMFIVMSFWIYKAYMPILYEIIAEQTLYKPLGKDYANKLLLIAAVAVVLPILFTATKDKSQKFVLGLYSSATSRSIVVALALLTIVHFGFKSGAEAVKGTSYSIIQIINRHAYVSDWQLISATNLWTTFIYLSPIGFCIYIYCLWKDRHTTDHTKAALLVFPLYYLIITIANTPLVFGGFYYARYQISEIIPFALLFIVVTFFDTKTRSSASSKTAILLAVLMLCYFVGYTSEQLQGPEGPRPDFYKKIADSVTEKDLIVVDGSHGSFRGFNEIIQPLEYFYNENIIRLPNIESIKTDDFKNLAAGFSRVVILSMQTLNHPAFISKIAHEYNFGMYHNNTGHIYLAWAYTMGNIKRGKGARVFSPPTLYSKYIANYYLYELDKTILVDISPLDKFDDH